eukprot:COSAG02_NODE_4928_length_4823_cov_19.146486_8_plen_84_part_00
MILNTMQFSSLVHNTYMYTSVHMYVHVHVHVHVHVLYMYSTVRVHMYSMYMYCTYPGVQYMYITAPSAEVRGGAVWYRSWGVS